MSVIVLKINAEGKASEKTSVSSETTLESFVQLLTTKTGIAGDRMQIMCGYPLALLRGKQTDSLVDIGLKNSDVVTIRAGTPPSMTVETEAHPTPPASSSAPNYASQPQSASASDKIFAGTVFNSYTSSSADEWSCHICTFINSVHSGSSSCEMCGSARLVASMKRRIIDADNSCLFNAVGLLVCRSSSVAVEFREIVRTAVENDPETFSSVMLGKQQDEYLSWIMLPTTWGGEVEIGILAAYFRVEIAVVDIRTTNIYVYGSGCGKRIYLLYDGIHYDALVRSTQDGCPADDDETMFPPDDSASYDQSKAIASELKQRTQFVDLTGFDLKCLVCGVGLRGQRGAQEHAKETGHTNFGQVEAR
jgi:ubiquitin thioesterase OTU1